MKFFNIFFGIYRTVLYLAIAAFLLVCIAPMAIGISPYVVLSGSMEPTIETGALAFVQKASSKSPFADVLEYKEYEAKDIVAYKEGSGEDAITVIHRLVKKDGDDWVTKGDNNENTDLGKLSENQIAGHFLYSIPKLGYFVSFLQSKKGIITAIVFCGVALISSFITDNTDEPKKKKKKDNLPPEEESHAGEAPNEG